MGDIGSQYHGLANTIFRGVGNLRQSRLDQERMSLAEAAALREQARFDKYQAPALKADLEAKRLANAAAANELKAFKEYREPLLKEQVREINELDQPLRAVDLIPQGDVYAADHIPNYVLPDVERILGAKADPQTGRFVKNQPMSLAAAAGGTPQPRQYITRREARQMAPALAMAVVANTRAGKALEDRKERITTALADLGEPTDEAGKKRQALLLGNLRDVNQRLAVWDQDPARFETMRLQHINQGKAHLLAMGIPGDRLTYLDEAARKIEANLARMDLERGTAKERGSVRRWARQFGGTPAQTRAFLMEYGGEEGRKITRGDAAAVFGRIVERTTGDKETRTVAQWSKSLPMPESLNEVFLAQFPDKNAAVEAKYANATWEGIMKNPAQALYTTGVEKVRQAVEALKNPDLTDAEANALRKEGALWKSRAEAGMLATGKGPGAINATDVRKIAENASEEWGAMGADLRKAWPGGLAEYTQSRVQWFAETMQSLSKITGGGILSVDFDALGPQKESPAASLLRGRWDEIQAALGSMEINQRAGLMAELETAYASGDTAKTEAVLQKILGNGQPEAPPSGTRENSPPDKVDTTRKLPSFNSIPTMADLEAAVPKIDMGVGYKPMLPLGNRNRIDVMANAGLRAARTALGADKSQPYGEDDLTRTLEWKYPDMEYRDRVQRANWLRMVFPNMGDADLSAAIRDGRLLGGEGTQPQTGE